MQMAAGNAAVRRYGAVRSVAVENGERLLAGGAGRPADMHLISAHLLAAGGMASADLAECLVIGHFRRDLEQTEARNRAGRTLDALWIGNAAPQHLIARTDAEQVAAAAKVGRDIDVPPLGPQLDQVRDSRFR